MSLIVLKKESVERSWEIVVLVFVEGSLLVLGLNTINILIHNFLEGKNNFETHRQLN